MASKTTNYNLNKIDLTDTPPDITVLNSNFDTIDSELKSLNDNKVTVISGKGLSTNDYTTTEKNKLAGIADNANNYTHPISHPASMITEDSTHRFVSDTEKNTWNAKASTSVATSAANGLMSSADKSKLDGVSSGANKAAKSTVNGNILVDGTEVNVYTHPSTHPATIITEDSTHRFVTDTEKSTWNAKASTAVATTTSNGLMSSSDKSKLDGIAAGAEVNQNAFSNVKVGATTVSADSKVGTLELASGTNITLTPDATSDKITITTSAEVNQNAFSNIKIGAVTAAADSKTDTFEMKQGTGIVLTGDATNDAVTIAVDSTIETTTGAQAKADQAEVDANAYTDQQVAAHSADYVKHPGYGVATGSANTYVVTLNPAPTSYTDGMAVSVKINADSTGAATLNVNGLGAKALKKANGNDATNLKANGVYTFRYNSSTGNFILQGEGGSGNAIAGDVLIGKSFSNDTGDQVGTMPNRGAQIITPGTANIIIPAGYHDGNGYVQGDADLIASNIKNGINIFGVAGTLIPLNGEKKVASGTATTGGTQITPTEIDGGTYHSHYSIEVTGLSFNPSLIYIWKSVATTGTGVRSDLITLFKRNNTLFTAYPGDHVYLVQLPTNYNLDIYGFGYKVDGNFYVSQGGFRLPSLQQSGVTMNWIAYE